MLIIVVSAVLAHQTPASATTEPPSSTVTPATEPTSTTVAPTTVATTIAPTTVATTIAPTTAAPTTTVTLDPDAPTVVAAAAPDAPVLGASGLDRMVRLTWTTTGEMATRYRVERLEAGLWVHVKSVFPPSATLDIAGRPLTPYTYRVIADNADGASSPSNVVVATPYGPPAAPIITAYPVDRATGRIHVRWQAAVSDRGATITGYDVQQSSDGTTWSVVYSVGPSGRNYTAGDLTPGKRYWFRVVARNAAGPGTPSTAAAVTARGRPTASTFSMLVAPVVAPDKVRVTWTAANPNGSPISQYSVQQSSDGTTWATVYTVNATGRNYTATGLTVGHRYWFRVVATNAVGSTTSITGAVTPRDRPGAPVLSARAPSITGGLGQVPLTWPQPTLNGVPLTGFAVQRSFDGSTWTAVATTSGSARSFTVTGLTVGVRYRFRVVARNTVGDSIPSNSVTVTVARPASALPWNSGTGRRIVYSRSAQRIWAVDSTGQVVKTHRVSGRRYEPYAGTYYVYSRSLYTYSAADPSVRWRYMVRFAYGPGGGRIGFHEIPNRYGVPLQSTEQLGLPLSGGCVRQSTSDALWIWNWAGIGTKVVVL